MSQCISNFLSASWFPSSYLTSLEIQPSFNSAQFVNVAQRCESRAGSLYLFPVLEHLPPRWVRVCPINREPRFRLRLAPRWVIANRPMSHLSLSYQRMPCVVIITEHALPSTGPWPLTCRLCFKEPTISQKYRAYTVHLCGMKEVPCWVIFKPGKLLVRCAMLSFLSSLSLNFSFL